LLCGFSSWYAIGVNKERQVKMEQKKIDLKILVGMVLLITFTLACGFFPNFQNIGDQVKERVLETVGSVSTEAVGNIQLTAEAMMGEMGPQIEATLMAIPPDIKIGKAPANIPVIPEPYGFAGSENRVLYMTTVSLEEAVRFYRQEMLANGWQETEPSMVVPKLAYMNFVNDTTKATISMIPSGDKLAISINISEK
jgi:hypothetical protein